MILEFIYDKKAVSKDEQEFLKKVYYIAKKEFDSINDIVKVIQYFPHEYVELKDGWENAIYPANTETIPITKKNIASGIIFDALEKALTIK